MSKDEKMKQILESLEKGVREFFSSNRYEEFLTVMSRFHNYSINNQMLIAMQRPDATLVAGYNAWIKNFERHVVKGEKAITIIAPQKKMIEIETEKADENGNAIIEKREVIRFFPVLVYDVSQTDGKELPGIVSRLNGNVENYNNFMDALRVASPYPFNVMEVSGAANGWCDYVSETIVIKAGLSEIHRIKTAVHEVAHARLHNKSDKSREQKEVEAESVAYVVCSHYGLDTSDYSFGYVASWSAGKDTDILRESLETIKKESEEIISITDRVLESLTEKIEGLTPAEIEEHAKAVVQDALIEMGSVSELVRTRVYGYENTGRDNVKVNVLAEFKGQDREDGLFNLLHQDKVRMGNLELDINPIKGEKSGDLDSYYTQIKQWEHEDMTDDTWPMVTVTYSSYPRIRVGKMNIYEAEKVISKAEELLLKDNIRGNFLRINLSYTYEGHKYENTHVVLMGEGRRNFVDYLSVPVPVMTYLHRHLQLIDTVERAKNEDAISPGTSAQEKYEDMMYEWAEKQRLELNYNINPDVKKPPEYDADIEKKHTEWEMVK